MDFPLKPTAVVSAVAAYGATTYLRPQWSTAAFVSYFVGSFLLNACGWAFWSVILYPKVFSPFRSLPAPKPTSWYNGNWKQIQDEPSGTPMLKW